MRSPDRARTVRYDECGIVEDLHEFMVVRRAHDHLGIGRGDEHAAHLIHIRLHLSDGFLHRDGVHLDPEDINLLRHFVTLP